jgi:hypothetical protein
MKENQQQKTKEGEAWVREDDEFGAHGCIVLMKIQRAPAETG